MLSSLLARTLTLNFLNLERELERQIESAGGSQASRSEEVALITLAVTDSCLTL